MADGYTKVGGELACKEKVGRKKIVGVLVSSVRRESIKWGKVNSAEAVP